MPCRVLRFHCLQSRISALRCCASSLSEIWRQVGFFCCSLSSRFGSATQPPTISVARSEERSLRRESVRRRHGKARLLASLGLCLSRCCSRDMREVSALHYGSLNRTRTFSNRHFGFLR